jgi:hypothetical protein
MAETAQKTGTPRRGGSRAGRAAAAKPAPSKAPAAASEAPTTSLAAISLIPMGETRQYSKWSPPENIGCVGTFYAPLGATAVTVTISGPSDG